MAGGPEDGVVAFVRARGVDVPMGTPEDPAGTWTIHGLAARKNDIFLELTSGRGGARLPRYDRIWCDGYGQVVPRWAW
jgi:hypothetical protein